MYLKKARGKRRLDKSNLLWLSSDGDQDLHIVEKCLAEMRDPTPYLAPEPFWDMILEEAESRIDWDMLL